VTFLFTDIEGSTRLWEEYADPMRSALARHDALLRAAIEQQNGYIFKTIGDAFCAVFHTAPNALNAALAAQLALTSEPWPAPIRIKVRMALHTGAAESRDNDYFGQPLNRVARLLSVGHGGQTLISAATQALIRDVLPAEAGLKSLGEHRLRDLNRSETVFQLLHPKLPAEFPPLKSLDNSDLPNNLPQQLTSFIGREKESVEVKSLLEKTRLLTLTGSGGCGKTRLSLHVAADVLDQYPDGVWLVELAPLADPALVPQTVATTLGLSEQPGKTFVQTLMDYLKSKRLLLVLDNCEHLLRACANLVDALLRTCPHLTIMASSREGLGVAGEQTYRVPSLSLPDPKKTLTAAQVSQYEAVRLFIERAVSSKADFVVTNRNAPALASVCHRLDGIPLAIELAAARVRSLSVEEINSRLDNRFRLLVGGSKTALPRQKTLQALIDWSYDLLTGQEKLLLCRLSVFAGGWTLAAAEQVCGTGGVRGFGGSGVQETAALKRHPQTPEPLNAEDVLDVLSSLVDKSLVIAEIEGQMTRYRLLETIRQYGRERLLESGESEQAQARHRDYYLALAEEAEPHLTAADQTRWLAILEEEHDNLRQALAFCLEEPDGAEAGLCLAAALAYFWSVRGHLGQGRAHLAAALSRMVGPERQQVRASALSGAGYLAWRQGDYAAARALLEESLTISRELGDKSGIAKSLLGLGSVALLQGDNAAARPLYEQSLAIRRELGDKWGIATSLNNLGNMALFQGDYAAAQALLEESLTISRDSGGQWGIATSLTLLGAIALIRGDDTAARALSEESLTISRELGDMWNIAYSLNILGYVASNEGDDAAARALYGESLTIARELGNKRGIAYSLDAFISLAYQERQPARAARLWGAVSTVREGMGMPRSHFEQDLLTLRTMQSREPLGEAAFAAAYEEGRTMTLEQAIEYALAKE
jgi:predicted ATPase/class 3 adenylate cyclase